MIPEDAKLSKEEIERRHSHPDVRAGRVTLCVGCKFYWYNGIKIVRPQGTRMYSKCDRPGAISLAADERKIGECGIDAKLKQ